MCVRCPPQTGPGCRIEQMKSDMGGAAAVLGAAKVLTLLKPPVEVHFVMPACENMIDGKAYRPGDVVTASNGMTIEIENTDAGGVSWCSQGVFGVLGRIGIPRVMTVIRKI